MLQGELVKKTSKIIALIAGVANIALGLPALAQDPELPMSARWKSLPWKNSIPSSGPIRPMRAATSRPGPSSATRTCTPHSPSTRGPSAPGWGPSDAYRFAKGQEVTASSGQPAKLSRPLDFLVVTDHSDNMGFFPDLLSGKSNIMADPAGRRWHDMIAAGQGADAAIEIKRAFSQGTLSKALVDSPDGNPLPVGLAGNR